MLTSRRLSSHSPASARQRLASRDLQFADAKVHCSVARHCWTSTKYTHCDAASSRSFSLHMFCHFAFVRTKLHSDLMTILAPAPQPPAPSPQPPQGTRPFGRMNMPFLLLSFFDDIRVARVCIRVRGPYLVNMLKPCHGRTCKERREVKIIESEGVRMSGMSTMYSCQPKQAKMHRRLGPIVCTTCSSRVFFWERGLPQVCRLWSR